MEQRCSEIQARQAELENQIVAKGTKLHKMGAELKAIEHDPHLAKQYEELKRSLDEMASQLKTLRREHSQNSVVLNSLKERLERLGAGEKDAPRAHIRHLAAPVSTGEMRFNRLIEAWAAVSLSLLLLGFVALIVFCTTLSFAGCCRADRWLYSLRIGIQGNLFQHGGESGGAVSAASDDRVGPQFLVPDPSGRLARWGSGFAVAKGTRTAGVIRCQHRDRIDEAD